MKTINTLCISIIVMVGMLGCSKTGADQAQGSGDSNTWKEMDDFHMIMAETFHPYKDSADLAPIKEKAGELVAAAGKWASSAVPKKVDEETVKSKLQNLKGETEVLADLVQKNNDQAIGDQLTKVHNLFHEIQEDWYSGGEHHHEHEH